MFIFYHTLILYPFYIALQVPQQPSPVDNGVYLVKFISSMLSFTEQDFIVSQSIEEKLYDLSTSDAFKFTPLDIWRMRSEIYLFIHRLTEMYTQKRSPSHRSTINDTNIEDSMNKETMTEEISPVLPALLDYSFLSNIIEIGDTIEYCLRNPISSDIESNLVNRATVIGIRVENVTVSDESAPPPMSVLLNNGDKIVDALHLVRRISMRNIYTNEPMWNPVRTWRELRSIYMYPTESAMADVVYTDVNSEPQPGTTKTHACDECPEMNHPSAIPVYDSSEKPKRDAASHAHKRWSEKLDAMRQGDLGTFLPWLKDPKRIEAEIRYLNETYNTFIEMGDPAGFEKLISARTKDEYLKEKKNVYYKFKSRRTKGYPVLKILSPLCYISWFVSLFNGKQETIIMDKSYNTQQSVRDFKRTEGMLKFERKASMLRIQYCHCCRENHLNLIKYEPNKAEPYKCTKCEKLDDDRHYLKKNLHPVWYERKPGAKSYKDFKLDSSGNRIVRYDIPTELSELTMAEQLLIRRCAPYIPSLHLSTGFYGIKGHCVAFPQDISEMCDVLPQRQESVVTFIRQMGNKNTSEVLLKHLKVRKDKVIVALNWLKLHHSGYHDIKIDTSQLDWMGNTNESSIKADQCRVTVDTGKATSRPQFVSGVQCAGELHSDTNLSFSTMAMSDVHTIPNANQSQPIRELVELAQETNQTDKVLMFPGHGDIPVR